MIVCESRRYPNWMEIQIHMNPLRSFTSLDSRISCRITIVCKDFDGTNRILLIKCSDIWRAYPRSSSKHGEARSREKSLDSGRRYGRVVDKLTHARRRRRLVNCYIIIIFSFSRFFSLFILREFNDFSLYSSCEQATTSSKSTYANSLVDIVHIILLRVSRSS